MEKARTRITKEIEVKIKNLRDKRMTIEAIAKAVGVSRFSVYSVLRKYRDNGYKDVGINRSRPVTGNPEVIEKVRNLLESGKTYREIMEQVGISSGSLALVKSKIGVKIRKYTRSTDKYGDLSGGESLEEAMARVQEPKDAVSTPMDTISSLNAMGMAPDAIAAKLGTTVAAVYGVLDNLPVKTEKKEDTANDVKEQIAAETPSTDVCELVPMEEDKEDMEELGVYDAVSRALDMVVMAHGKALMDISMSHSMNRDAVEFLDKFSVVEQEIMYLREAINGKCDTIGDTEVQTA